MLVGGHVGGHLGFLELPKDIPLISASYALLGLKWSRIHQEKNFILRCRVYPSGCLTIMSLHCATTSLGNYRTIHGRTSVYQNANSDRWVGKGPSFMLNTLWHGVTIWCQPLLSTLAQLLACRLCRKELQWNRNWNQIIKGMLWERHLPIQWRYNGHHGVSNHHRLDCLLNRLFRHR